MFLNVSPPGMNCCEPSIRCSVTPFRKKSIPECRDERRHPQVGGDHAVHEPDRRGQHQRRADAEPDREVVLLGVAEDPDDRGGERVDPAHGEIDLAADQEHHLTRRDQRDRGHRLGDVLGVVALDEDGVLGPEVHRQRHRDDEDARLAAAKERAGNAPAEAGALPCGLSQRHGRRLLRDGVLSFR